MSDYLSSFRELLLNKVDDPSLEVLVKYMRDDVLVDLTLESLEKMARARHKGSHANLSLRDFATEMDPEIEGNMLHSALSHHASRYKAALKQGRQDLANEHAKQIFKLMDLADQAQRHSHGKLSVEAVSPHAWERNIKLKRFTEESKPVQSGNKKVGQFVTDTKGWRYRGSDYSFLQHPPHESYISEVKRHGETGAYPLEKIRVNGRYLHIKEIPPEELAGYKEHEFDKHPITKHYSTPVAKHTPEHYSEYKKAEDEFHESPHMESWLKKHEAMLQDPEHQARLTEPDEPIHPKVENPLVLEEAAAPSSVRAASSPAAQQSASSKAPAKELGMTAHDQRRHLITQIENIKKRLARDIAQKQGKNKE